MIVYNLVCKCGHEFESWFRDSATFDTQLAKGRVLCPACNSKTVAKAVMAPNIAKSADRLSIAQAQQAAPQAQAASVDPRLANLLTQVRDHVEKNYDYVGERFPEEARKIHYGEVSERQIYGEASAEEVKALSEEGVPIAPLPRLPRRNG